MEDMNPMTGNPFNPEPTTQPEPKPRVSFEDPVVNKLNELVNSDEAAEFAHMARMASKTKFATGNVEVDIRNWLTMKKIGKMMSGMMNDED